MMSTANDNFPPLPTLQRIPVGSIAADMGGFYRQRYAVIDPANRDLEAGATIAVRWPSSSEATLLQLRKRVEGAWLVTGAFLLPNTTTRRKLAPS